MWRRRRRLYNGGPVYYGVRQWSHQEVTRAGRREGCEAVAGFPESRFYATGFGAACQARIVGRPFPRGWMC